MQQPFFEIVDHLTAQRSNGLRAVVERIKADAAALHETT